MSLFTPAPPRPGDRPALFTPTTKASAAAPTGGGVPTAKPYELVDPAFQLALQQPFYQGDPSEPPSPGIMRAFAVALERWTLEVEDPTAVDSHLELLATYEALCDREIGQVEARLQQPSSSAALRADLADEAVMLRGERSSWRLLRMLYAGFDARQQPPPEMPPPPEDWSAHLRLSLIHI